MTDQQHRQIRLLEMRIDDLELSFRTRTCLQNWSDVTTVRDLVLRSESELLRIKNMSSKSIKEIKTLLSGYGLSLGMRRKDLPVPAPAVGIGFCTVTVNNGHVVIAGTVQSVKVNDTMIFMPGRESDE